MPRRYDLTSVPRLDDIEYREPYTEAALQAARDRGDPLADDVIDALKREMKIGDVRDLLRIVRERAASEGGVYRRFLDGCNDVPPWVDWQALERGQRLVASLALPMGLSLLTGSLVGGYVFVKAAKVIALTGRLSMKGDISRRLMETSALVLLMSRPAELRPGGRAHETLVRVRLLHGAIRHWMAESGRWRAQWDLPINQEDLAITLSEFSYLNLRGLTRMGVSLSDEEIESWAALWRYAGHVLGIEEELLPKSFDQEIAQFLPMLKHQAKPREAAKEARLILDEVADRLVVLPKGLRREFFYQVTAHLIGPELVEGLGVELREDYPGLRALRAACRGISFVRRRVPLGEPALHALGQLEIDRFLRRASRRASLSYGVKTHDREVLRASVKARMQPAA